VVFGPAVRQRVFDAVFFRHLPVSRPQEQESDSSEINAPLVVPRQGVETASNVSMSTSHRRLLPVYVTAFVVHQPPAQAGRFLMETLTSYGHEWCGWRLSSHRLLFDHTIRTLGQHQPLTVLSILWQLVNHQDTKTRLAVIDSFEVLLGALDTEQVARRVLPALFTLSRDADPSVTVRSIQALRGPLLNAFPLTHTETPPPCGHQQPQEKILSEVTAHITGLLDGGGSDVVRACLDVFYGVTAAVAHTSGFGLGGEEGEEENVLTTFIVPHVCRLATLPEYSTHRGVCSRVAECLMNIARCPLPKPLMAAAVLPSLRHLAGTPDVPAAPAISQELRSELWALIRAIEKPHGEQLA